VRRAILAALAPALLAAVAVAATQLGATLAGAPATARSGDRAAGPGATAAAPGPPKAAAAAGLPLSFEPNAGQADPAVRFLAHGPRGTLYLTATRAIVALITQDKVDLLRMRLLGARRGALVAGDARRGMVSYLVGSRPSRWRRRVPTYGQVTSRGVYRGIDLRFHASRGELEYDFDVAAGADPHTIAIELGGARSLHLDARGRLVIALEHRTLVQDAPRVYQVRGGARRPVPGRYVLRGPRRVGFAVGAYDRAAPLVIDPTIAWSTYLGGDANDVGTSIAVDRGGNAYVAGSTSSADLPLRRPLARTHRGHPIDAFVAKLDPSGQLVYATYLGGSAYTDARGIAVDRGGHAYVTGATGSRDFPIRRAVQPDYGGGPFDGYVSKLSASGDAIVYSTFIGGPRNDRGYAIAVGADGAVVAAGRTAHDSFPAKGALAPGPQGGAFVTKLAPGGGHIAYSTVLGGSDPANSSNTAFAVAVDRHSNAWVTGITAAPDFPVLRPLQRRYGGGTSDAFVTRIDARGSAIVSSTYLGGSGEDEGLAIAVDRAGRAYVTGQASSRDFPETGAPIPGSAGGGADAFVAKLTPRGSALAYSVRLGGGGEDAGNAIAVDGFGTAVVAGATTSRDFPVTAGALQPRLAGPSDAFVTALGPTGSGVRLSSFLGGAGAELGLGVAVGPAGDAYVTGQTDSADFPTLDPAQGAPVKRAPNAGGGGAAFVTRLAPDAIGG
jgi:hypothetical protein